MTEIHIDEESLDLLDKYCKIRPSTPGNIVDRVVREWYSIAARQWVLKRPMLNDFLLNHHKVPEGKTTAVNINHDHAREYLTTITRLNQKCNVDINPVALTSWLVKMFIRMFNMKYMTEHYQERMGQIRKV